ncbi:hypothetical protein G5668_28615, partial [Escherichia coli]
REGPFYFLFTDKDGEKYGRANKLSGLDKALAAGATEITKEEYLARKNGTYTDLPQNVDTAEEWKALRISTRRTLAAISIMPAIVKLARRQIP